MELDAVNWKLVVLQSHDFAFRGFCRDVQRRWQSLSTHDERMVSRRLKGIWEPGENTGSTMLDRRRFPMHQLRSGNDFTSEDRADALMAKTNAEDRCAGSKLANNFVADACVFRAARPG